MRDRLIARRQLPPLQPAAAAAAVGGPSAAPPPSQPPPGGRPRSLPATGEKKTKRRRRRQGLCGPRGAGSRRPPSQCEARLAPSPPGGKRRGGGRWPTDRPLEGPLGPASPSRPAVESFPSGRGALVGLLGRRRLLRGEFGNGRRLRIPRGGGEEFVIYVIIIILNIKIYLF